MRSTPECIKEIHSKNIGLTSRTLAQVWVEVMLISEHSVLKIATRNAINGIAKDNLLGTSVENRNNE